jgi:serine protease inhibitor
MIRYLPALLAPLALAAALPAVEPGRAAPEDTAAVVKGNNAFAFDLYGRLRETEGNLFFSPYSVEAALAMTSAGARGRTLEEMEKTLHYPPQEQLHPAFKALNARLNGEPGAKRGYQLSTANRLWGRKGYGFRPEFLKVTKDHYGAGLEEVDFGGDAEGARKTINAWVEKETHDKIKDLLKPGAVKGGTRLVLTNAIYFKGDWRYQFKKDATREQPFTLADGKQVKAPLMQQKGRFRYGELGDVQVLELPYAGKELSMLVLLPKKADGLADLEKGLSADRLAAALGRLHEFEVEVTLPKFKTTSEFELAKELSELGMPTAFTPEADLSGISGGRDLYISQVVHKAFVEVNEEGTEAAAATAVVVDPTGAVPMPVFRADHPFVYLIRDNQTGAVLFLGRLSDPTR